MACPYALFELRVQRWRRLDHALKDLAVMGAAAKIGCAWCMDFGYWEATTPHKVPAEKIRAVPAWRDSDVFTELESAASGIRRGDDDTPPSITDEMVKRLSAHPNEAELVELTAIVAVENLRSRINSALGLTSQGFKYRCEPRAVGGPATAAKLAG